MLRVVEYDEGPSMLPLVIQIERLKEHTAETCAFAQSPVRIGRNPLNDIELDDGYVSQWHGVIRFVDGATTYLDLGATNATIIDGKPIERNVEMPITETTDLRIGSFRLHVFRVDAPQELFGVRRKTAFARTGTGDASSVAATLFFADDPTRMRTKEEMDALLSGRGPSSTPSEPVPGPKSPLSEPPLRSSGSVPKRALEQSLPSVIVAPSLVRSQQPISLGDPAPSQRSSVSSQPPPIAAGSSPGADVGRPSARHTGSPPPLPPHKPISGAALRAAGTAPTVAVARSQSLSSSPPAVKRDGYPYNEPDTDAFGQDRPISQSMPIVASGTNDSLHTAYENYRNSWRVLLAELRRRLERAGSAQRADALDTIVMQFPDVGRESEFRALLSELGLSPLRTGVPEMEDWLRRLTDNKFPPPNAVVNVALAMERIGEVLEVFSTAFVEMRDAHGRFCDEMSLERPTADTVLQTTKDPRHALAYLLNPGTNGASKVDELARSMADFALHQVALVSAVVEGARGMLSELSPDAKDPKAKQPKRGWFSNEAKTKWEHFRGLFTEMMDEDRFTRKLFGRQFARKYYAIMGGRRTIAPTEP
jgi:predicted component of type VI protein secretion system